MSMSDSAESNTWKLIFQNITWAGVGDATGLPGSAVPGSLYVAFHTADPGETGNQTTNETSYTNYARVAVARSSGGWTLSGTAPTKVANTATVTAPQCGATGATLTHFSIGKASSGAGEIIVSAALDAPITVSNLIAPIFPAGMLAATLD